MELTGNGVAVNYSFVQDKANANTTNSSNSITQGGVRSDLLGTAEAGLEFSKTEKISDELSHVSNTIKGSNININANNALDIGGASPFEGTPVYAAAAGVVSGMIHEYSCGGNMLYINVNVNGEEYTTYYYHLLDFNVSMGDVVTQDTVIGWVGGWSTSTEHGGYDNCTTGSHLHYGVAKGYYNPYTGIIRSNESA